MALPSFDCETVQVTDRDDVAAQIALPKLVEKLKAIPLSVTENPVRADLELDLRLSTPSGRITATMRGWADKERVVVESGPVQWMEDFRTRTRTIRPMKEAEAEHFRGRVLTELQKLLSTHVAAMALATEPEGLEVVITRPEGLVVPISRSRTIAVLGCLPEGTELEGYVTWPDGSHAQFKQRASQVPGRVVVGGQDTTAKPAASATTQSEKTPREERPFKGAKTRLMSQADWGAVGGLVMMLVAVIALLLWLRRPQ